MKQNRLVTEDISANIKSLREERNLSMRKLARMAGISASLICKIESGKVSPTVISLGKLLDAMDINLHDFFGIKSEDDSADGVE